MDLEVGSTAKVGALERSAPASGRGARSRGLRGLRCPGTRRVRVLVAAATLGGVLVPMLVGPTALRSAAAAQAAWRWPVDGPVVRAFQPPDSTYGPGHRGVDLAAAPGSPVRAAGAGTVVFSGEVAGGLHVVVEHRGGLRTSYSYLLDTAVAVGMRVDTGAIIGRAGGGDPGGAHPVGVVHFGLRVGDRYVDPSRLFQPRDLHELVRLVPVEDPAPNGSWARRRAAGADEAASLAVGLASGGAWFLGAGAGHDRGCGGGIPGVGEVVDAVCDGIAWGAARTRDAFRAGMGLLRRAGQEGRALAARLGPALDALLTEVAHAADAVRAGLLATPYGRVLRDVVEIGERFLEWTRRECSTSAPPADGTGGSGHLLMAVAGIDSSSSGPGRRTFGLDTDALGYHRDEVRWYSYAPDGGAYTPADTEGDLRIAASRLAEQLRAIDREQPGREVDLIAHSQGGIVVDLFLRDHYDASDPTFPPIGTVVTLASPHQGAPLATSGRTLREHPVTRRALDVLDGVRPGPASDAPSVRQLAETSPLMRGLWARGLPEHIDFTTIGGTDDLVVPANRIRVPGATEVVVGVDGVNDHSAIVRDDRALQAVRAALEHRPPPCTSILEGLRSAVEPVLLSRVAGDLGEYLTTYLDSREVHAR